MKCRFCGRVMVRGKIEQEVNGRLVERTILVCRTCGHREWE